MLFRKRIVRYIDSQGRRVTSTTPGAIKKTERSTKWYVRVRLPDGRLIERPGYSSKEATRQLESRLLRDAEEHGEGLGRYDAANRKTLTEHVDDFRQHLDSKGNTAKHVRITLTRITTAFEECRFKRLPDLDASKLAAWLKDQRETGMAAATSNYYLRECRAFAGWCVRTGRLADNPFRTLNPINVKTDRRRVRRTLSATDFARLLHATGASAATFRGHNGEARRLLYLFAARTGLREAEIASLTERSLRLDLDPPTVSIEAIDEKARRGAELPIHPDVAAELRRWLQERNDLRDKSAVVLPFAEAGDAKLWGGTWHERGAKMLRLDLDAAGIPYLDDAGRVFDFHSLRAQFISDLGRAGVSLQEAQKLARHSDPKLTANGYTHLSLSDLAGSVARLPSLPTIPESVRATGTDDASLVALRVAPVVAVPCDRSTPVDATTCSSDPQAQQQAP